MHISKIKWSKFLIYDGGKKFLAVILICLIGAAFFGAQTPFLMAELSKSYGVSDDFYLALRKLTYLFIAIYINQLFFQLMINKYIMNLVQFVRADVYQTWLLNYDAHTGEGQTFEKYPMGEVIARIMSDTQAIRELLSSGAFSLLIDLFFVISALIAFLQMNKVMGLFIGGTEIAACLLLIWGSRHMRGIFNLVRTAKGKVSQVVSNIVGGISETYFMPHGNYATKTSRIAFDDFLDKQIKANIWDASYYSVAESLYPVLLALVVFVYPYSGLTEAALVFAIVDLIQRSSSPIKGIAGKIANIQRAATGFYRVQSFMQDLGNSASSQLKTTMVKNYDFIALKIEIKDFFYKKNDFTLKDIFIEGKKGELIGLVGLSGSGKSTILNIVSGNIIPDQAGIVFSASGNRELLFPGDGAGDLSKYREQIGIISQDSHIFSESLAFNISLEREQNTRFQEFWDWICQNISYLNEWGIKPEEIVSPTSLSLGQSQLISAIRACYLQKPVILFDEVSSGLDSSLELALRKVILLTQKNSLTIVVAHRVETVMGADNIYVLDNGRLLASGKHQNLLKNSQIYRQFIDELKAENVK